jgi:hypothetical protein
MIITPGLIGLLISLFRRDTRHWPLWIVLPALLGAIVIAVPLSRYRQALTVLWIPWAVYFAFRLVQYTQQREWPRVAALTSCLAVGWALSLGPLSRCPPDRRDRPSEYLLSIDLYQRLGQPDEAERMKKILRDEFPKFQPGRVLD